jgi:hypothetical protein
MLPTCEPVGRISESSVTALKSPERELRQPITHLEKKMNTYR